MSAREFDPEELEVFDPVAVANKIAERFGLRWEYMRRHDARRKPYAAARAELYARLREQGWPLTRIGRFVGRDHSTVRAGLLARAAGKYVQSKPSPKRRKK